jgi:hypothetical protein
VRVFVVYTDLLEETRRSLADAGTEWTGVDVSGDRFNYQHFMAARWKEREPFVVVEHDVVFHPSAIDELVECPRTWCAFPYVGGVDTCCMGLMKVGVPVMETWPNLWLRPMTWEMVAWHFTTATQALPHQHLPAIVNL